MLMSKLKAGSIFNIHFFGGEPLLHPEAIKSVANFAKLEAAGRQIHVQFACVTNATRVTSEVASLLAELHCHMTVSLDGPAEFNDATRPTAGGQGSTTQTLKGLQELLKVRSQLGSLCVNGVFGEHNMHLVEAYLFYRQFNFDSINMTYSMSKQNDGLYSQKYTQELSKVYELAAQYGGEAELRKFVMMNHYFRTFETKVRTVNHCGAGKSLLHTDANGELYTCAWLINDKEEKVGQDLELHTQKLEEYASPIYEKNNCQSCWARFICGGGCMYNNKVKNGNKYEKDPHFCQRTRQLLAEGISHFVKQRLTSDSEVSKGA